MPRGIDRKGHPMSIRIDIPIKLPSLANLRLHWLAMDRLKRGQKDAVAFYLHGHELPTLPVVVTITRCGPRTLDSDNAVGAAKYVRDSIAAAFGVDDASDLYEWRYRQAKGPYGVVVEIEEVET